MNTTSLDVGPLMKDTDPENKPEIKARMALPSDLSSLVFLEKRSGSEDMWSSEEFSQILEDKKIRIVLTETFFTNEANERKASPAAYLAFEVRRREVIIWSLCVAPYLRRRGVGKGLLGWLKEASAEHLKAERLSVVLRESDLSSQLFLKGCNFLCHKTIKEAYECPPENGMLFHFPLSKKPKP